MKKIFSIAMIAVMCAAFTACGNSAGGDSDSGKSSNDNKTEQQSSTENIKKPSEKAAELLDAVTFPQMVEKDMEFVEVTFGITSDMVTDHIFYVCGSGAMPDEFGIFEAADADAAASVKAKIDSRIAYQKDTYTTYSPDEAYKLTDSFCEVNGNTVIYAICADNSKAREILK